MKTKTLSVLILLMAAMAVPFVFADAPPLEKAFVLLHKPGKTKHLILYPKDPSDWSYVMDSAYGKLTYKKNGKFVFNGHGLVVDTDYCLINWGGWGEDAIILGTATAVGDGHVHMAGSIDYTNLLDDPDDARDDDFKIWLVPCGDMTDNKLTAWNPTDYLFEYDILDLDWQ